MTMRPMGRRRGAGAALAMAAAFACASEGASAQTEPPEVTLPAVQVQEEAISTSAQRAIAARRRAPNAVTVIEAEQLNQFGDQPLGDALRRLPGVTFPGGNRARDLRLRGIGDEYTQVLVNGRALIDGNSRRGVQVDRIPSSLVERVEIVRSPLATQDGQGAAGTVNIVLKNQRFDERRELGVGAGYLEENGELGDATALLAGDEGALRFVLGAGVQRQRRNESKDTVRFTGAGAPAGGVLESNERRFDQVNLIPALELALSGGDTLRLEPTYLRTKEFRDDRQSDLTANQVGVTQTEVEKRERVRENVGLYGAWVTRYAGDSELTVSLDYQRGREDTFRDATRFNAAGVINRTRLRTEDVDLARINPALALRHRAGHHDWGFGADYSLSTRDEDNSDFQNGAPRPPNAARVFEIRETRRNAYAQDTVTLEPGGRLTVGLRLEDSDTRTTDFSGRDASSSAFFVLPSAHYVQALAADTDLRAGVARTLRRPDLRELSPTVQSAAGTVANPDVGGNPDLVPESVWGVDLGLDRYVYGGRGLGSVNGFYRRFDDKIEALTAQEGGRFVARPRNAGDGWMAGVELEGRLPLVDAGLHDVTVWANATAIRTRLVSAATGERRRFLDQPDFVANAGVDWFVPSLRSTFGASMNWVSGFDQAVRQSDGSVLLNEVGDALRIDLSARFDVGKSATINVSALNVLARTEDRADRSVNAAGALAAASFTTEPTYRTIYVRWQATW